MTIEEGIRIALQAREDEITQLRAEVESWKAAFAAQSRKLQHVLHIPGVREELRRISRAALTAQEKTDADDNS